MSTFRLARFGVVTVLAYVALLAVEAPLLAFVSRRPVSAGLLCGLSFLGAVVLGALYQVADYVYAQHDIGRLIDPRRAGQPARARRVRVLVWLPAVAASLCAAAIAGAFFSPPYSLISGPFALVFLSVLFVRWGSSRVLVIILLRGELHPGAGGAEGLRHEAIHHQARARRPQGADAAGPSALRQGARHAGDGAARVSNLAAGLIRLIEVQYGVRPGLSPFRRGVTLVIGGAIDLAVILALFASALSVVWRTMSYLVRTAFSS